MIDGNRKNRAWFQIHLSTAVILMVVAGILLCLNLGSEKFVLLEPSEPSNFNNSSAMEPSMDYRCSFTFAGWPKRYSGFFGVRFEKEGLGSLITYAVTGKGEGSAMIFVAGQPPPQKAFNYVRKNDRGMNGHRGLYFNFVVGIVFVIICGLSESLIRHVIRKEKSQD